jgi:hypothetical protein
MTKLERTVHEVSNLWDFARRMGWLRKTPQYQAALRATAHWPENPNYRRTVKKNAPCAK